MKLLIVMLVGATIAAAGLCAAEARYAAELVFPLHPQHNHAPGIVECPNGDLLVSWYRGSGERSADDVAVFGARRRAGEAAWSEAFLMADVPGFPDGNTCMMLDRAGKLWLFWPTVVANTWESCLTRYRTSSAYAADGPPQWDWQGTIFIKPAAFREKMLRVLDETLAASPELAARLDEPAPACVVMRGGGPWLRMAQALTIAHTPKAGILPEAGCFVTERVSPSRCLPRGP